MTLSDEALRRLLLDRALSVDHATIDLIRVAEAIAAHDRARRGPLTAALGLVAAFIVVAVGSAGFLARLGSPGESSSASAGVTTSFASSGPSLTPSPAASPSASLIVTGCEELRFAPSRCARIVAAARAGNPTDVVRVVVRRSTDPGVSLGTAPLATVDLFASDGTKTSVEFRCFPIHGPSDRLCDADPQIFVAGGVDHDTPCGPQPGDENHPCATLPPTPRPASVASSTPLRLPSLDIPLNHLGHYEALAGIAWLPDGALTERSATLADARPTTFWIDSGVEIDVRDGSSPCPGGCPSVTSVYHKPYDGPMPVRVYLVFDVTELTAPAAVLQVRDLVVR